MSGSGVVTRPYAASRAFDRILRYTRAERLNHWIGALSYTYLLLTGLGFWSPYLFWMTALVGGGPTARFWHPWIGLVFTASVVVMQRHWRDDMRATDADRSWWKEIDHYIRNEDESLPPVGKFNYGQKLWYWLIFYGVIFLLLSGVVLWFTESLPWSLRFLRYVAILLHVGAALLTIGGFFIHVYMSTALERGSFTSMMEGTVSKVWARTHHRLWYEEVTGEPRPKK
ncbi:MAG: formate dehydrogenase subunit gamma [Candidatus Acidiferrales bacterium]